jgi:hypothetical protein
MLTISGPLDRDLLLINKKSNAINSLDLIVFAIWPGKSSIILEDDLFQTFLSDLWLDLVYF